MNLGWNNRRMKKLAREHLCSENRPVFQLRGIKANKRSDIRSLNNAAYFGLEVGSLTSALAASCFGCFLSATILSSRIEISTSTFSIFSRSISAYSSFVIMRIGLQPFSDIRFQKPGLGSSSVTCDLLELLYIAWPMPPNSPIMIAPGRALDRPLVIAPTAPPLTTPARALALVRSLDVRCLVVAHVCSMMPRVAQKVVPRANVCIADAVANNAGVVLLNMPAVPPTRKPAPPRTHHISGLSI